MASLGTRIKRAREAKRWSQQQLARMLEVDRKTVDNWENDRTYPRSSIGAIELVLGVNLTDDQGVSPSVTPDEAFILSLDRFTEDEKRRLVDALRDWRGARHA